MRVNGKDIWDFEERDAYLMKVFVDLQDQLTQGDMAMGGAPEQSVPSAPSARPTPVPLEDMPDDDLPF